MDSRVGSTDEARAGTDRRELTDQGPQIKRVNSIAHGVVGAQFSVQGVVGSSTRAGVGSSTRARKHKAVERSGVENIGDVSKGVEGLQAVAK